MRSFVFCLVSLLGAGATSQSAADVSTPPLSRSIAMRVHRDWIDVVFREFATAAARAGLKCHPFAMVGHRENYCDLGADVSVVGIQVSGPPEADSEEVRLEVQAVGHGSDRDKELTAIGDRIIDELKAAMRGNPSIDKVVECGNSVACRQR
jgi:hypothetical protein